MWEIGKSLGTSVLKWGLGKAVSTGLSLSPFALYIKIGLISVLLGVVGTHLWNDRTVRKERDVITGQLAMVTVSNVQLQSSLEKNKEVLETCIKANTWNAEQASNHKEQADEALANVRLLEAMNDRDTEDIIRETNELRNKDDECRTADEPLPAWLLPDSLWDD